MDRDQDEEELFAIALIGIRPRVLDGVKEERKRWS